MPYKNFLAKYGKLPNNQFVEVRICINMYKMFIMQKGLLYQWFKIPSAPIQKNKYVNSYKKKKHNNKK